MLALFGTFLVVTPVLGVQASLNQVDVVAQSYPIVSLLLAIVAVLFIGSFEELAFRGAIQSLIRSVAGPRVGTGAAALVFGLFHALAAVGPGVIAYIAYATAGLSSDTSMNAPITSSSWRSHTVPTMLKNK